MVKHKMKIRLSIKFWISDDTRTGISAILKRDQYAFNFRFKDFWWYHVILHRFSFNLDQSDKKSDQPGILGPPRPFSKFNLPYTRLSWGYTSKLNSERSPPQIRKNVLTCPSLIDTIYLELVSHEFLFTVTVTLKNSFDKTAHRYK